MDMGAAARAVATLAGLGLSAVAGEYAVPIWSRSVEGIGGALPTPTTLLLAATGLHLPAVIALFGGLALGVLLARGSARLNDLCLALLLLAVLHLAVAAWALALPLDACGFCAAIGGGVPPSFAARLP